MRRQSKKTAQLYREFGPLRKEYLAEFPTCAICGRPSTEVHEMLRGVYRRAAFQEPASWLSTCGGCNRGPLLSHTTWPRERQAAVKLLSDPERFNLQALDSILEPRTIDREEFINHLRDLILCQRRL